MTDRCVTISVTTLNRTVIQIVASRPTVNAAQNDEFILSRRLSAHPAFGGVTEIPSHHCRFGADLKKKNVAKRTIISAGSGTAESRCLCSCSAGLGETKVSSATGTMISASDQ